MNNLREQIAYKIVTCILVVALLVPIGIKFSHIFSHHQHEICNGEPQTHLHKADVDCSFNKFQLTTPFTIPTIQYIVVSIQNNHQQYFEFYSYLNIFQVLNLSLRGPPQIDLA